ncbi:TetR/AcrR family transcriptional regulator [Streptomyces sp. NPDC101150]|uniref:TetR/AcrR family transcriptional regulator n=1 Tax=Streptomyces sp. NPDC101150 TaxID=3366114 RepID=UPI00382A5DB9
MNAKKTGAATAPTPRSGAAAPPTALRADARRNRARVLKAAQEAFATEGPAAPLDEIARLAGVGAGTVYRHFPTKEALFEAVILSRVQEYVEAARELITDQDPGKALFTFIQRMIHEGGLKKDLADALTGAGCDVTGALSGVTKELNDSVEALLVRAQEAGAVRDDIGITELMTIIASAFLANRAHVGDTALHQRVVTVILDGLRGGPTKTTEVSPH